MAFRENAQSIKENIPKLWLLSKKRDKEGGGGGGEKEKIYFGFVTGLTLYSRLGWKWLCNLSWPQRTAMTFSI